MSVDDDIARLAELGRELPTHELDREAAARIAQHARAQVGAGPDRRRLVVPILAAAIVVPYTVWVLAAVIGILR